MKKIAIVGIGGIGGFVGTKLSLLAEKQGDYEITFVQRGLHLQEIKERGLVYKTKSEYVVKPAHIVDRPAPNMVFDLIIFCVKSKDLEQSAQLFEHNAGKTTVVLPLLNGVDNDCRLTTLFPDSHVLNGCIYVSAGITQPGVVAQIGGAGFLHFGDPAGKNESIGWIQSMFSQAGIKSNISDHITYEVWRKFLFVSPLALVTALYQEPIGYVVEHNTAHELWLALLDEFLLVAQSLNVALSQTDLAATKERINVIPFHTKTSLQSDFERKSKTELDVFAGFICRLAREHMVLVPNYNTVYHKLKIIEDDYVSS